MRFTRNLLGSLRTYWHTLNSNTCSDKQLAMYLAETFESEFPDGCLEGLRFFVKKRIVTIYGTLYSESDHELLLKIASRIVGLEAIVDRVHVIDNVYSEDMDARIYLLLTDSYAPKRLLPA